LLIKEVAPAVLAHPEARITEVLVSMTNVSVLRDEVLRTILREATHRFNHELLDDEERLMLLDRIKRICRQLRLA
jgi:hypothetical protein